MARASVKAVQTVLFCLVTAAISVSLNASAQGAKAKKKVVEKAVKAPEKMQGDYMLSDPSTDAPKANEPMKFNTDATLKNSDHRSPLKFKDGPEATPIKTESEHTDSIPEDQPFKTFVGYPKHKIGAAFSFLSVGTDWTYKNQDFNFRSNSAAYGINYTFIATPQLSIGVDYIHYGLQVDESDLTTLIIEKSKQEFDEYYAKFRYCFISNTSFGRRLCPGLDFGNDAYPVLQFADGTHLTLGKVQDFVVGANLMGQLPFTDLFFIKAIIGANLGTGVGNSGPMTSKSNSSYYGTIQVDWLFGRRRDHDVSIGVDYKARNASVTGKIGSAEDTWDTKATSIGGRLGYAYTFE